MSQLDVGECWKKIAGKMWEEVLNKYKVEDSKRGAYRGGGAPLECEEARNIEYGNGVNTAGQGSLPGSESTTCNAHKVRRWARPRRKR